MVWRPNKNYNRCPFCEGVVTSNGWGYDRHYWSCRYKKLTMLRAEKAWHDVEGWRIEALIKAMEE